MNTPGLLERARAVRLLVLDVDGVMTDGSLWFGPEGEQVKRFDVRDGQGIRLLIEAGIQVAIVSGRSAAAVERRAESLGITRVVQGAGDKLAVCRELAAAAGLGLDGLGAVGDDLPDLPVLRRVAFAATVPAAPELLRRHAHYVTAAPGGGGAVRELAELLLTAQGRLEAALGRFLA